MKRHFTIKGINFFLGNMTPRNNEFEKGLKYRLFVEGVESQSGQWFPTSHVFCTLKEGKEFAKREFWRWL